MRRVLLLGCAALWPVLACSDRESRPTGGGYCLDRMFGGDHYNLTACGLRAGLRGKTDNGPLDGTVQQIGWNKRYIVVFRRAVLRSEGDGWMILDADAEALRGPLSDAEWERERERDPALRQLAIHPVAHAWRLLGGPSP
jgi:hypothetical protein